MNKIKKSITLKLEAVNRDLFSDTDIATYTVNITKPSSEYHKEYLDVFIEEEPKTLKEFSEANNIKEESLVKWLNKNFV